MIKTALIIVLVLIFAATFIETVCPTKPTESLYQNNKIVTNRALIVTTTMILDTSTKSTSPVIETTTQTYPKISPYHICPRSMNNYLLLTYQIYRNCQGGPSENECSNNSMCPANARACCQQLNGCNKCVVPCPQRPKPPTNCLTGFTPYDSPTGCVHYVCNEELKELKIADDSAVQVGLKQRNVTKGNK